MDQQRTGKMPPQFFMAYVEALVAYREIMRATLASMHQEYGDELRLRLGIRSFASLIDAHDTNFLTHRAAAQFLSRNRSKNSVKIVNAMYKQLRTDRRLLDFANKLRATDNTAIADDLPFYIEYRLRLARVLSSENGQATIGLENVIGLSAHA